MLRPIPGSAIALCVMLTAPSVAAAGVAPADATQTSASAQPAAPAQPPAQPSGVTAGLKVGTTQFEGDGASVSSALTRRIRSVSEGVLVEHGIEPDDKSAYTVEITIGPHGDEGYLSDIVVRKDGQEVPDSRRDHLVCELCTEGELLDQLRGELKILAPMITATAAAAADQEADATPEDKGEDENGSDGPYVREQKDVQPEGPLPTTRPENALSGMARAGIATFVVGAVTVGAGAGVYLNGTQTGNDQSIAGAVVVSVGAALSVTGAVLLIVDHRRRKKMERLEREQRAAKLQVASPYYDPRGRTVGVALSGRF